MHTVEVSWSPEAGRDIRILPGPLSGIFLLNQKDRRASLHEVYASIDLVDRFGLLSAIALAGAAGTAGIKLATEPDSYSWELPASIAGAGAFFAIIAGFVYIFRLLPAMNRDDQTL